MAKLTVKVPIKFSDKAQKELYETCMAYKELAEIRGAVNDELQKKLELLQDGYGSMSREHSQTIVELSEAHFEIDKLKAENRKLRKLVPRLHECEKHYHCDDCPYSEEACDFEADMRELGVIK
jgi:hypothetical protein